MSKKTRKQINNSFKIIIILLTTTLLGSFFYIYKISDRTRNMVISLREQKMEILKDLEKSETVLNQTLTSNHSLSQKLESEKAKVKKLIADLKNKDATEKTIIVYQKNANDIDGRIQLLTNEIEEYKKKIDSTKTALKIEKIKADTLVKVNKKLETKLTSASKLYYYNLQTATLKVKSSGKNIETQKARRVDLLKISFMIAENEFAKPSKKDIYIQIIDTKNNVIGTKKTEKFGKDILTYSAYSSVKYESKTTKIEQEIPVSELEEGTYFVNVFDRSKLVLKTSFVLE
ncbi:MULTISPECIES: hypothetical protein [unclassified Flavobacterium]|uniref:hypothetical protein n=1 Tax=unclassified Flavobacterium TaxID=196869 RepID=UPI0036149BFC